MTKVSNRWFKDNISLLLRSGEWERANEMALAYAVAYNLGRSNCPNERDLAYFVSETLKEAEQENEEIEHIKQTNKRGIRKD